MRPLGHQRPEGVDFVRAVQGGMGGQGRELSYGLPLARDQPIGDGMGCGNVDVGAARCQRQESPVNIQERHHVFQNLGGGQRRGKKTCVPEPPDATPSSNTASRRTLQPPLS